MTDGGTAGNATVRVHDDSDTVAGVGEGCQSRSDKANIGGEVGLNYG
jgi:hypothetical protein